MLNVLRLPSSIIFNELETLNFPSDDPKSTIDKLEDPPFVEKLQKFLRNDIIKIKNIIEAMELSIMLDSLVRRIKQNTTLLKVHAFKSKNEQKADKKYASKLEDLENNLKGLLKVLLESIFILKFLQFEVSFKALFVGEDSLIRLCYISESPKIFLKIIKIISSALTNGSFSESDFPSDGLEFVTGLFKSLILLSETYPSATIIKLLHSQGKDASKKDRGNKEIVSRGCDEWSNEGLSKVELFTKVFNQRLCQENESICKWVLGAIILCYDGKISSAFEKSAREADFLAQSSKVFSFLQYFKDERAVLNKLQNSLYYNINSRKEIVVPESIMPAIKMIVSHNASNKWNPKTSKNFLLFIESTKGKITWLWALIFKEFKAEKNYFLKFLKSIDFKTFADYIEPLCIALKILILQKNASVEEFIFRNQYFDEIRRIAMIPFVEKKKKDKLLELPLTNLYKFYSLINSSFTYRNVLHKDIKDKLIDQDILFYLKGTKSSNQYISKPHMIFYSMLLIKILNTNMTDNFRSDFCNTFYLLGLQVFENAFPMALKFYRHLDNFIQDALDALGLKETRVASSLTLGVRLVDKLIDTKREFYKMAYNLVDDLINSDETFEFRVIEMSRPVAKASKKAKPASFPDQLSDLSFIFSNRKYIILSSKQSDMKEDKADFEGKAEFEGKADFEETGSVILPRISLSLSTLIDLQGKVPNYCSFNLERILAIFDIGKAVITKVNKTHIDMVFEIKSFTANYKKEIDSIPANLDYSQILSEVPLQESEEFLKKYIEFSMRSMKNCILIISNCLQGLVDQDNAESKKYLEECTRNWNPVDLIFKNFSFVGKSLSFVNAVVQNLNAGQNLNAAQNEDAAKASLKNSVLPKILQTRDEIIKDLLSSEKINKMSFYYVFLFLSSLNHGNPGGSLLLRDMRKCGVIINKAFVALLTKEGNDDLNFSQKLTNEVLTLINKCENEKEVVPFIKLLFLMLKNVENYNSLLNLKFINETRESTVWTIFHGDSLLKLIQEQDKNLNSTENVLEFSLSRLLSLGNFEHKKIKFSLVYVRVLISLLKRWEALTNSKVVTQDLEQIVNDEGLCKGHNIDIEELLKKLETLEYDAASLINVCISIMGLINFINDSASRATKGTAFINPNFYLKIVTNILTSIEGKKNAAIETEKCSKKLIAGVNKLFIQKGLIRNSSIDAALDTADTLKKLRNVDLYRNSLKWIYFAFENTKLTVNLDKELRKGFMLMKQLIDGQKGLPTAKLQNSEQPLSTNKAYQFITEERLDTMRIIETIFALSNPGFVKLNCELNLKEQSLKMNFEGPKEAIDFEEPLQIYGACAEFVLKKLYFVSTDTTSGYQEVLLKNPQKIENLECRKRIGLSELQHFIISSIIKMLLENISTTDKTVWDSYIPLLCRFIKYYPLILNQSYAIDSQNIQKPFYLIDFLLDHDLLEKYNLLFSENKEVKWLHMLHSIILRLCVKLSECKVLNLVLLKQFCQFCKIYLDKIGSKYEKIRYKIPVIVFFTMLRVLEKASDQDFSKIINLKEYKEFLDLTIKYSQLITPYQKIKSCVPGFSFETSQILGKAKCKKFTRREIDIFVQNELKKFFPDHRPAVYHYTRADKRAVNRSLKTLKKREYLTDFSGRAEEINMYLNRHAESLICHDDKEIRKNKIIDRLSYYFREPDSKSRNWDDLNIHKKLNSLTINVFRLAVNGKQKEISAVIPKSLANLTAAIDNSNLFKTINLKSLKTDLITDYYGLMTLDLNDEKIMLLIRMLINSVRNDFKNEIKLPGPQILLLCSQFISDIDKLMRFFDVLFFSLLHSGTQDFSLPQEFRYSSEIFRLIQILIGKGIGMPFLINLHYSKEGGIKTEVNPYLAKYRQASSIPEILCKFICQPSNKEFVKSCADTLILMQTWFRYFEKEQLILDIQTPKNIHFINLEENKKTFDNQFEIIFCYFFNASPSLNIEILFDLLPPEFFLEQFSKNFAKFTEEKVSKGRKHLREFIDTNHYQVNLNFMRSNYFNEEIKKCLIADFLIQSKRFYQKCLQKLNDKRQIFWDDLALGDSLDLKDRSKHDSRQKLLSYLSHDPLCLILSSFLSSVRSLIDDTCQAYNVLSLLPTQFPNEKKPFELSLTEILDSFFEILYGFKHYIPILKSQGGLLEKGAFIIDEKINKRDEVQPEDDLISKLIPEKYTDKAISTNSICYKYVTENWKANKAKLNGEIFNALSHFMSISTALFTEILLGPYENYYKSNMKNGIIAIYDYFLINYWNILNETRNFSTGRKRYFEIISTSGSGRSLKIEKNQVLRFPVYRDRLFESTMTQLYKIPINNMICYKLSVEFLGEPAIDLGGPFKEWISLFFSSVVSPKMGLFQKSNTKNVFIPDENAHRTPDFKAKFNFIGRIFAKCILDGYTPGISFGRCFLKRMLDKTLVLEDLKDINEEKLDSLNTMLAHNIDEIDHFETFRYEDKIDLVKNGSRLRVSEKNKGDYVRLVCQHHFNKLDDKISEFKAGFFSILPKVAILPFDEFNLGLLIAGNTDINIEEMKKSVKYEGGYTSQSNVIIWLWRYLSLSSPEMRVKFLFFVTGSSVLPDGGFKDLSKIITIVKNSISTDLTLPSASTCYNQLKLPNYSSQKILELKLEQAIMEGCLSGYGFS